MGKNYLIAGGSKGIGKGVVEDLLQQGHNVIVLARTAEYLPQHSALTFYVVDFSLENPEFPLLDLPLDGLVYAPGSIKLKPASTLTLSDLQSEMQLNCFSAYLCIRQYLPLLKKSGAASIVLFSSVAVQLGMPYHLAVSISKGAVEGMVKALAAELAPSIRVNAVAPSLTDTGLAQSLLSSEEKRSAMARRHPLGRIGTTADISSMVSFLLSDKTSWVTGQVIGIDGGMGQLKTS